MIPALQISIPTFNRPIELSENLKSILNSLQLILPTERTRVSVAIYDNSTLSLESYSEIVSEFSGRFKAIGCNKFSYQRTGFDIGSANNCSMAVLKSDAQYTWLLPDDDLSSADALDIILKVIDTHAPCMIHGGDVTKNVIHYADTDISSALNNFQNTISKVLDVNKVEYFLQLNPVQAQEHVYKTEYLKEIMNTQSYIQFIDEMFPAFFSILCLNGKGPAVFTSQSLGIFRDGDPRSSWRHRWLSLYCIKWPQNLRLLLDLGLISEKSFFFAMSKAVDILYSYRGRLDILLGVRRKFAITPLRLFKNFKVKYLKLVLLSLLPQKAASIFLR